MRWLRGAGRLRGGRSYRIVVVETGPISVEPGPTLTEPDPLHAPVVRRRRSDRPDGHLRLTHQPGLDGLRGLAVAAVVAYHAVLADGLRSWSRFTSGGFLGVSAFFTLSGFLIVSLMVLEMRRQGTVSMRGFWSRRFRRLLPASLLLLGAVVLLTPLVGTPSQLVGLPGDVWASLADVANWRFILNGSDYARQFAGDPSPVTHMWSLSVEEQWYLLLPLSVLGVAAIARRTGRDLRWSLGVVFTWAAVASLGLMVWLSGGTYTNRAYLGTDTRFSEMAIGALLAVVLFGRMELGPRVRRAVVVLGTLALPVLIFLWATTHLESDWLYRGGFTIHAVLVALVIVAVVQPAHPLRSVLSMAPLAALGRISYGVYLFHWPIVWWLTPDRLHLPAPAALAVQVASSIALAAVSYRLLEQPIRHGRLVLSWRRPVLPMAAMAVIALGAAALPAPDSSQIVALSADGGRRMAAPTTAPEPSGSVAADDRSKQGRPTSTTTTSQPPPPLRIMIVGDSFATSIAVGMLRWGPASGEAAVLDSAIVGCPFAVGGRVRAVGMTRDMPPECLRRDEKLLTDLRDFRPDVVVVAGGMWDVADRRPPGFRSWVTVRDPDYDAFLSAGMSHLLDVLGSTGAKVLWATSPHWSPVPGVIMFTGDPPYHEADPARADRFNEILASVVSQRPGTALLDLPGWMRSQPGGEFDPSLRIDGVHFTMESTDRVAAWLGPELLRAVGRNPTSG